MTLQPLTSVDDPDWAAFQTRDPAWNLTVAGREIRRYCGWHIYPNLQQAATNLPIGAHGIIQLPSLHVTDVAAVLIQHTSHTTVLDPARYTWHEYGVIEPHDWAWWSGCGVYGPFSPTYQLGHATVTFTSGYDEPPDDVKQVAFELATTTMEVNAGNVKEIQTPGYRLQTSQPYGATLNDDQKNRLAPYRLPAVA